MDIQQWHERYLQQSGWTTAIRKYLIEKMPPGKARSVLDVGFGTGAVKNDWPTETSLHGLDISFESLVYARENSNPNSTTLVAGDALRIPYKKQSFDLVTCHFFLLWIVNPLEVFQEMIRVEKPGGRLLFFAEPDYGARIDFPAPLEELGRAQFASLENQGADPMMGRKLLGLAASAGLSNIEVGIMGYQTISDQDNSFWEKEWEILQYDLAGLLSEDTLADLHRVDKSARQSGSRILYVPTFYLSAEVP